MSYETHIIEEQKVDRVKAEQKRLTNSRGSTDLRMGSRFIRVMAVKLFDEAASRDMREGFPRII